MTSTRGTRGSTRTKVLDASMRLFGALPITAVTMADVAREVGVTSQALYRYYRNRDDLYRASLQRGLELVELASNEATANDRWPFISGRYWQATQQAASAQTMVTRAALERDALLPELLRAEYGLHLLERVGAELARAQSAGHIRKDVDASTLALALSELASSALIPLALTGKYGSPEWRRADLVQTALLFHPMPDLSTTRAAAAFEARFRP